MVKEMIAVPDRIVDSGPPTRNDGSSPREVRKVVVIQVKRRTWFESKSILDGGVYSDDGINDGGRNTGHVLGTKVVDLKDGRVVFWLIKRTAGKNLGFEYSYLQGAAAAIVFLDLSDRETIQVTKELLRDICKVFSIPVMLVVGGTMGENSIDSESPVGLGELASKVISFTHDVGKTPALAS
jgi:hypothetical protein